MNLIEGKKKPVGPWKKKKIWGAPLCSSYHVRKLMMMKRSVVVGHTLGKLTRKQLCRPCLSQAMIHQPGYRDQIGRCLVSNKGPDNSNHPGRNESEHLELVCPGTRRGS